MSSELSHDASLRRHLVALLLGSHAHADFESAIRDVPEELRGVRPEGVDHSLWELLEHLRMAQSDILEFSRNPSHVSPQWPEGYWPLTVAPPDDAAWEQSVEAFGADLEALQQLVSEPSADLFQPFAHGKGQTLLREAMLVADHNAYHVGQVIALRRLLGDWPPGKR
jgi:uncharacterized damage-inducible protein DinB